MQSQRAGLSAFPANRQDGPCLRLGGEGETGVKSRLRFGEVTELECGCKLKLVPVKARSPICAEHWRDQMLNAIR
jgi:hypothetical protein